MFVFRLHCLLAVCVLASCGAKQQESSQGALRVPLPDGRFAASLVETQSATILNTVSLVAGLQEGVGLRAYAGIIPNQPAQPALSGEATFEGPYEVAFIKDIVNVDNFITGRNAIQKGTITLTTDLSEMTLFGTDGVLTVRARILDNTKISGEVDVFNVPGVLEGEIGDDRAFGAFYGSDLTHLYSGGFVTSQQP